jgi:hypothetical protein
MLPMMVLSLVALTAGGCTFTEPVLRAEYSTRITASNPQPTASPICDQAANGPISDLVHLTCLERRSSPNRAWRGLQRTFTFSESINDDQCLYIAADIGPLLADPYCRNISQKVRNQLISYLLSISDRNCAAFRSRVFANKAGLDTNKNILQDLTTAAAAAATFPFPAAAVALNVANVIVGKTVSQIDATYFSEKTFSAMDDAIVSKRNSLRATIKENSGHSLDDYTIMDALGAVHEYDAVCSIQGGIDELASMAATAKVNTQATPSPSPSPANKAQKRKAPKAKP